MTSVDAALAFAKSSQLQVSQACTVGLICSWHDVNRVAMETTRGEHGHHHAHLADLQGVVVEASGMADRLEEVLSLCHNQHAVGIIAPRNR